MRKAGFILIVLILVVAVGVVGVIGTDVLNTDERKLVEGKNYVSFSGQGFASDVILLNPDVEAISYFDEDLNKTIGYVNVFGGVGSNFLIVPERTYELIISKNTSLVEIN
jgi:hypothetical protein